MWRSAGAVLSAAQLLLQGAGALIAGAQATGPWEHPVRRTDESKLAAAQAFSPGEPSIIARAYKVRARP